jgi:selenide,water dikinase
VLDKIAPSNSAELLVGFETSDDAAVYRLSDDMAALLTVDFFTPIVDDPYDFGRITAANALSDIYAMGGRPLAAMNLLAFPCSMGADIVGEVVRGGAEKVAEAGAVIVGGHTIDDAEPKYGLAVFGTVHPDRVVRNAGARPGDVLFLTKPVGTGIFGTALKNGIETEESAREVIESMATLNARAAEAMLEVGVRAATDLTGFGVLGHLHEMLEASGCAGEVDLPALPLFDRAFEYAARGVVPGRTADVIAFAEPFTTWAVGAEAADRDTWMRVLCDPQTSGGLLMSVPEESAGTMRVALESRGVLASLIGRVVAGEPGAIAVR